MVFERSKGAGAPVSFASPHHPSVNNFVKNIYTFLSLKLFIHLNNDYPCAMKNSFMTLYLLIITNN